jgi:hypothetical protein
VCLQQTQTRPGRNSLKVVAVSTGRCNAGMEFTSRSFKIQRLSRALIEALDEERHRRNLTWKQLVAELPGFTQWLKSPAATFVRARGR